MAEIYADSLRMGKKNDQLSRFIPQLLLSDSCPRTDRAKVGVERHGSDPDLHCSVCRGAEAKGEEGREEGCGKEEKGQRPPVRRPFAFQRHRRLSVARALRG